MKSSKFILFVIVVSQFLCTSLWFASNSVIDDLIFYFSLSDAALSYLTTAIQFGFIIGTIFFAAFTIADRYSPSKVFFVSAILGAFFNLLLVVQLNTVFTLVLIRFSTGFFLAGIYPVGMKIAADYFSKNLGKSLGFLVGALVLGTAFPHLLKSISYNFSWQIIIYITSLLAFFGGLMMLLLVADGPNRKSSSGLDPLALFKVFKNKTFRLFAFGYFGHMWELYAFWVFIPVLLQDYFFIHNQNVNISLLSFVIIASGSLSCIISGHLSQRFGLRRIAIITLALSCLCCLLSPLVIRQNSSLLFIVFLIFWGMVVIADSPLFSSLIAKNVDKHIQATALTIVNCIGYAITIISIELLSLLHQSVISNSIYLMLALGPLLGLVALYKSVKNQNSKV